MNIKQHTNHLLSLLADIAILPVRGNVFPPNRDKPGDGNGVERRTKRNVRPPTYKGE
jgi:hypothetical protein